MSRPSLDQRCWNHETREAVCRCPQCGRSFCRECVTEHDARLLCAACLASMGKREARRRRGRLGTALMALAGILLAWILFFAAGEAMILTAGRMEQRAWQRK
jgi:hypothetical protein